MLWVIKFQECFKNVFLKSLYTLFQINLHFDTPTKKISKTSQTNSDLNSIRLVAGCKNVSRMFFISNKKKRVKNDAPLFYTLCIGVKFFRSRLMIFSVELVSRTTVPVKKVFPLVRQSPL